MKDKKPITIEELEAILQSKEPMDIQINPDGSVTAVPAGTAENVSVKVITMEHACATHY